MKKTTFILIAALVILGGAFVYFKPMFSVNGQIIFRPEFDANLSIAKQAQIELQNENPDLPAGADLDAATAQRILEVHLIDAELKKEIDSKTLAPLLNNKINYALQNSGFMSAEEALYGLNPAGIRDYIIVPQAEQDLLRSNLLLQGKSLEDWLVSAQKTAEVKIYFGGLKWSGGNFGK